MTLRPTVLTQCRLVVCSQQFIGAFSAAFSPRRGALQQLLTATDRARQI